MQANALGGRMRNLAIVVALAVAVAVGLVGVGQGGLATSAQEDADARAGHPIVGVWNVKAPGGPALAVFFADGTNIQAVAATQAGPGGVTFVSTEVGTWEPTGPRSVHFTSVQLLSDANGAFVGTVTIDAYPTVSEDGQTLLDDDPRSGPTIRDAAGTVVDVITGGPPATGVRMGVGAPGFPAASPAAGTPTS